MSIEDGLKDKNVTPIFPFDPSKIKEIKWQWYEYPEIWARRSWSFIGDIPREIRWAFQRVKRGYADRDVWDFHYFLSDVIYHGLLHLRKYKHGTPSTEDPKTGEWTYDDGRWTEILDKMIAGFEIAYKISNGDLEHATVMSDPEKAKMEASMQVNWPEFRFITWEEEITMKEAFYLFSKYYFSLWD